MIPPDLHQRVADSRERAVHWLSERVAPDGRPLGAGERNAWWRVPWALLVGGEPRMAASVLAWAERHALTDDGDLAPGPYGGGTDRAPVYYLAPLAIAAWQLDRFATADAIMDTLVSFQSPSTGGAYVLRRPADDDTQDLLRTCQLGIAALSTGRDDVADGVASWLEGVWDLQPDLPGRLFVARTDSGLVTEFAEADAFDRVVDFSARHQAYFNPGIGAVFLALHATKRPSPRRMDLAVAMLDLNRHGSPLQFEDPTSVQICKYGWGAAVLSRTTGGELWRQEAVKMATWFVDRQDVDGSWSPSSFITPRATDVDRLWKTAEHLMELAFLESALTVAAQSESSASGAVR